ncbi:hypothetical protein NZL82_06565 [Sphingomonas sanguinis]|uniref:hypothetical protein n=1 Tax=Sphingomonas sp. LC-1 TaxID=3110957 RepID=UPI0021BA4318|nr:hypothetical protein [Sphingomonas sp. LC-1]MCT8001540.1 hypothetical protein [Sphingomonas sp. LC-1]
MTQDTQLAPRRATTSQKAVLRLAAGRRLRLRAKVEVTSSGLLAIGGLVSSILLSTAILVGVATRHGPGRSER